MTALESAGLTLRPMRRVDNTFAAEDLDAAVDVCRAADLAAIGTAETGRSEVVERLLLPMTDLAASGLILRAETPVAFVWVYNDVTAHQTATVVAVAPVAGAAEIEAAAIRHCLEATRGHREEAGTSTWTMFSRQWLPDERLGQALAAAGFSPARQFYRMLVDSDSPAIPATAPQVPDGVEFVVARSDADRHDVYSVENEAFADHWNHTPRTWDEWWGEFENNPSMDEDGWWLLKIDGDPAAILVCEESLTERNLGYVGLVAVRRPYRGRGLAKFLLQRSFVRFRDMGRVGTQLGVDADSPTGAVDLYESVGMRRVLTSQIWARDLD